MLGLDWKPEFRDEIYMGTTLCYHILARIEQINQKSLSNARKKETGAPALKIRSRSELENRAKFDFLLRKKLRNISLRKLGNKKTHNQICSSLTR